jgi:hypothetical protein
MLVSGLNYDQSNNLIEKVVSNKNTFIDSYKTNNTNDINILRGKRDGAPTFLNTTY